MRSRASANPQRLRWEESTRRALGLALEPITIRLASPLALRPSHARRRWSAGVDDHLKLKPGGRARARLEGRTGGLIARCAGASATHGRWHRPETLHAESHVPDPRRDRRSVA